jgi:hypothetical protein
MRSPVVKMPALVVMTILVVLQGVGPAARQAPLPSGREIVARHVAAIGGADAFRAVTSMRVRGRLEIPAQKIAGDLEILSARPAKMLYRVTVPALGRIENGYNGKIGWSTSPMTGPELLSGAQLSETADDAWFDGPLHAEGHVRELTTLTRMQFDGRDTFQVKVVFASGNEQMEYFDAATGFQIGTEASRATPKGVVPTVNILRDYRNFGALMQPTTVVLRALGFEQIMTVTAFEYNTVRDSEFDAPASVKALVAP